MRHLVRIVIGQVLPALVPDRKAAARLDRQMRLAALRERGLDNAVGFGEAPRRIAGGEALMRHQVRRQALIDQRSAGRQRRRVAGHRRQRLVVDFDQFGGVLGEVAVGREDADHGVALEPHLVGRQGLHLDRVQPLDRRRHVQRHGPSVDLGAANYSNDAGRRPGAGQIDAAQSGMRVR